MIASNDNPYLRMVIPPTQSPVLVKFLELINERWLLMSNPVKGRRNETLTEYYVEMPLSELVIFHDHDLVKGEFKSKVLLEIEGEELFYWEFKKVIDGFASQTNELYDDLKTTKSYDILSRYVVGVDIPDWVDPKITLTQTYQYPIESFKHQSVSDFLVFNIRSGGSYQDSIKEIAIVQVSNGQIESVHFYEISNDLDTVWKSIEEYFLKDQIIAAFNLGVHKSNLEKSLKKYGINLPNGKYVCIYNMAKASLGRVEKHTMENICYALRVPFIDHCKDKAYASAEIALKIEHLKGKSFNDYHKYLINNKLRYGSKYK